MKVQGSNGRPSETLCQSQGDSLQKSRRVIVMKAKVKTQNNIPKCKQYEQLFYCSFNIFLNIELHPYFL